MAALYPRIELCTNTNLGLGAGRDSNAFAGAKGKDRRVLPPRVTFQRSNAFARGRGFFSGTPVRRRAVDRWSLLSTIPPSPAYRAPGMFNPRPEDHLKRAAFAHRGQIGASCTGNGFTSTGGSVPVQTVREVGPARSWVPDGEGHRAAEL